MIASSFARHLEAIIAPSDDAQSMEWTSQSWDACLANTGFFGERTALSLWLYLEVVVVEWSCLHREGHVGDLGDWDTLLMPR